jgi:hypothetical protein
VDLTRSRAAFAILLVFAVGYTVNLGVDGGVSTFVWMAAAAAFAIGSGIFLGSLAVRLTTEHRGPLAGLMTSSDMTYAPWLAGAAIMAVPFVLLLGPTWQVLTNAFVAGALSAFVVLPPGKAKAYH